MITWLCKYFTDLSNSELYAILRLRNEVFIVEQNCPYQDLDNKDQKCYHLAGWKGDDLLAYTRLIPPGVAYPQISIGRVVSSPSARRTGIGRELMKVSLEKCRELFGDKPIRIGAQLYLQEFYASFGFAVSSDIYLEDGIRHIEMIRS